MKKFKEDFQKSFHKTKAKHQGDFLDAFHHHKHKVHNNHLFRHKIWIGCIVFVFLMIWFISHQILSEPLNKNISSGFNQAEMNLEQDIDEIIANQAELERLAQEKIAEEARAKAAAEATAAYAARMAEFQKIPAGQRIVDTA